MAMPITLDEILRTKLMQRKELVALTSIIRPDVYHEEDKLPCVLIERQTDERDTDFEGYGGMTHATVDITGAAKRKIDAEAIAWEAKDALEGKTWVLDDGREINVESIPNRSYSAIQLQDGTADFIYEVTLHVRVNYPEKVHG